MRPARTVGDRGRRRLGGFDSRPRRVVSTITLVTGLAATAMAVVTVGVMVYFALGSLGSDRHSPPLD